MKKIFLPAAILAFVFTSCKKTEVDTETQSAVDNAVAEQAFNAVVPTVNSISVNEPGVNKLASPDSTGVSCAMVTVDTGTVAGVIATMTIDYGIGCLDNDGRFKEGKLVCTFYDRWNVDGARMTVDMQNFFIDKINYQGTLELIRNTASSLTYKVLDGKCVDPAWTILYNCDKTIEQTAGTSTLDEADDVFKFSGSSNGTNRKNKTFTTTIKEPMIKSTSCKWIETGVVEIVPEGLASRTLNFGNGTCDNKATITINGNTYDFEMR